MSQFSIDLVKADATNPNSNVKYLAVSFGRKHMSQFILDVDSVGGATPQGDAIVISHDYGKTGAALMSVPALLLMSDEGRKNNQVGDHDEFFALFTLNKAEGDDRTAEEIMVEYEEIVNALKNDGRAKAMAPIAHAWIRHFQYRACLPTDYPELSQTGVIAFGYVIDDSGNAVTLDLAHMELVEEVDEPFTPLLNSDARLIRGDLLIEQLASFTSDYYEEYRKLRAETYTFLQENGIVPPDVSFETYMANYVPVPQSDAI